MLQPGDLVTHIDYGIAKFAGLEKKEVNGHAQEAIRLVYRDDDLLYVSIHSLHKISKYSGRDGALPVISKLGTQEWENKKSKAKKRVKDIAKELISLYAKRKTAPGYAFQPDSFLQAELESSFMYEDTADQGRQRKMLSAICNNLIQWTGSFVETLGLEKLKSPYCCIQGSDRGKASRRACAHHNSGYADYRTFSERLSGFPVKIDYVSRFKSEKEIKDIVQEVKKVRSIFLLARIEL